MIKKGTFIEINYTGLIKENNKVFDTSYEEIAKKENIFNKNLTYNSIIICIGEHQILPGLDEELENKELGNYEFEIPPEKAFGKKNPKLMQLVSTANFRKQNIIPYPGLQVNIDGILGIIRTVTPGRAIIDFNHPLSGKNLIYKIEIKRIVTDVKEQLDSLISFYSRKFTTEIKQDEAVIKADLQEKIKEELEKTILRLIYSIKKITILKE